MHQNKIHNSGSVLLAVLKTVSITNTCKGKLQHLYILVLCFHETQIQKIIPIAYDKTKRCQKLTVLSVNAGFCQKT